MYSQMNCLIENEYIRELSKNKTTDVFPNELPNWKRIHKGAFPPKKITYSQMNCLIENEYIRELAPQKIKPPMHSQMNCLIENEY